MRGKRRPQPQPHRSPCQLNHPLRCTHPVTPPIHLVATHPTAHPTTHPPTPPARRAALTPSLHPRTALQAKELIRAYDIRKTRDSQAKGFGSTPGECLAFKIWRDVQAGRGAHPRDTTQCNAHYAVLHVCRPSLFLE